MQGSPINGESHVTVLLCRKRWQRQGIPPLGHLPLRFFYPFLLFRGTVYSLIATEIKVKAQSGASIVPPLREGSYRQVLDRLILPFADQQLITSFTLVLTSYIKLVSNRFDVHLNLIAYLSRWSVALT
jgi:hypothetical protein